MNNEDSSFKEILIGNKVRELHDKLLDVIEQEFSSISKEGYCITLPICICLTASLNMFTTVVSTYIYEGYFDKKKLVDSVLQDFKVEVHRKLEGYKQEDQMQNKHSLDGNNK